MKSSVTRCTSTSTETAGQSSKKACAKQNVSLVPGFQLQSAGYPIVFTKWESVLRPMSESTSILKTAVAAAKETFQSLLDLDSQLAKAADLVEQCLRAGNKLLVCGNGGSAADASHFATEFVVRFTKDRPAYPAICLASDGGLLTAAGNDYGFDEVFARQVAAFGVPGDVLICLTTSGKSRNIERALPEAKARKVRTITFLGRDGGSTIGMADVDLLVHSDSTARIQEAHQLLLHVLCETVELRLRD
jgi:D-sedoheptulose 7-phosphate isomerase